MSWWISQSYQLQSLLIDYQHESSKFFTSLLEREFNIWDQQSEINTFYSQLRETRTLFLPDSQVATRQVKNVRSLKHSKVMNAPMAISFAPLLWPGRRTLLLLAEEV